MVGLKLTASPPAGVWWKNSNLVGNLIEIESGWQEVRLRLKQKRQAFTSGECLKASSKAGPGKVSQDLGP